MAPTTHTSTNNADPQRPRGRMRRWFEGRQSGGVVRAAPPVPLREIARTFWPYARPYRRYLVLIGALIVAVTLINGAKLYMIKVTVDEVLVPGDLGAFFWIASTTIGLTLVGGAVTFFENYLSNWVGGRFVLELRGRLFSHIQNLSMSVFQRRPLGDILSRLTADISAIEALLISGSVEVITAAARLLFFAGALALLDWRLALVAVFVSPVLALIVQFSSSRIRVASREVRRRTGAMSATAEASLSNVALVQAYNHQQSNAELYERENRGAFDATMVVTRLRAAFVPLTDVVQALSAMAVLSVGVLGLRDGRLSLGELLLFVAYLTQLYAPIRLIGKLYGVIFGASAGAERVIELLREEPAVVERAGAVGLGRASGEVVFDGVSFGYPGVGDLALSGVSFSVGAGETVALVGHSGAGKSTLARLLLRFYDPSEGAIYLDGRDLRDVRLESLRENCAVVLQETLLFEGTVAENIRYGRPDASDAEVLAAAEAADVHTFIDELEQGYETVIGERGSRLSGGQRQRVAVARAMIRNAPVILLDEPTTGLDSESSQRILGPLRRLMSDATTIVISHNLLTARDADRIVVLDHGRIVEQGTHDQLAANNGPYTALLKAQTATPPTPTAHS